MTQTNNFTTLPVQSSLLIKHLLIGAGLALILISIFLLGAGEPNPAWSKLWIVKPLIIVPLAGAMGGAFYHFMNHLFILTGWKKVLAVILSLLGYLIALWLGTVLGLNGTMWN